MVLVCHPHKFIFLKTRKTAGTSVEMALEPLCRAPGHVVTERTDAAISDFGIVGRRIVKPPESAYAGDPATNWAHHDRAKVVKRRLGREIWSSYARITTTRNPYDREISAYHFLAKRLPEPPQDKAGIIAAFRAFVAADEYPNDRQILFIKDRFLPQHVIRYEHMLDDLEQLSSNLGLGLSFDNIPHTKNTSSSRLGMSVEDYFDAHTASVLQQRKPWAFEKFGYSTDWRIQ